MMHHLYGQETLGGFRMPSNSNETRTGHPCVISACQVRHAKSARASLAGIQARALLRAATPRDKEDNNMCMTHTHTHQFKLYTCKANPQDKKVPAAPSRV